MFKKTVFLIILFLFIVTNVYAQTNNVVKIITNPNLKSTLVIDKKSIKELQILSKEYDNIRKAEKFNKDFYAKLTSFINKNSHSYSALSALILVSGMCFLDETSYIYSKSGQDILKFIVSKYPKSLQGKLALYTIISTKTNEGNFEESLKMLNDNKKTILSIKSDKYYASYNQELNFEDKPEDIEPNYYFLLGLNYFNLKQNSKSVEQLNKVVKLYPKSEVCIHAQRLLNTIKIKENIDKSPNNSW